jgi:hypothetical protein
MYVWSQMHAEETISTLDTPFGPAWTTGGGGGGDMSGGARAGAAAAAMAGI